MGKTPRATVRHKRTASFKGARSKIQAYVTPDEKLEVEQAAELEDMGVSGFASRAVLAEARRVLADRGFRRRPAR